MASVTCKLCNQEYAIIACNDCQTLVCKKCSSVCRECGTSVCLHHTKQTKSGTKMCGRCMAEREARRQALRDKYGKTSEKPTVPVTSTSFQNIDNTPTPHAPSSSSPTPSSHSQYQSTSLEDLTGGEQLLRPTEAIEPAEDETKGDRRAKEGDDRIPQEEREEAFYSETGRLELPPMDQNRPVLGQSGYQPPSKVTTLCVLIFFGIAMIFTVRAVPSLHNTLFPFTKHQTTFNSDQMPVINDTNAIRDGGNIQGLDIFAQSATFFVAWIFVILYGGGIVLLLIGLARSMYWARQAKQQQNAIKGLNQNDKDLYR